MSKYAVESVNNKVFVSVASEPVLPADKLAYTASVLNVEDKSLNIIGYDAWLKYYNDEKYKFIESRFQSGIYEARSFGVSLTFNKKEFLSPAVRFQLEEDMVHMSSAEREQIVRLIEQAVKDWKGGKYKTQIDGILTLCGKVNDIMNSYNLHSAYGYEIQAERITSEKYGQPVTAFDMHHQELRKYLFNQYYNGCYSKEGERRIIESIAGFVVRMTPTSVDVMYRDDAVQEERLYDAVLDYFDVNPISLEIFDSVEKMKKYLTQFKNFLQKHPGFRFAQFTYEKVIEKNIQHLQTQGRNLQKKNPIIKTVPHDNRSFIESLLLTESDTRSPHILVTQYGPITVRIDHPDIHKGLAKGEQVVRLFISEKHADLKEAVASTEKQVNEALSKWFKNDYQKNSMTIADIYKQALNMLALEFPGQEFSYKKTRDETVRNLERPQDLTPSQAVWQIPGVRGLLTKWESTSNEVTQNADSRIASLKETVIDSLSEHPVFKDFSLPLPLRQTLLGHCWYDAHVRFKTRLEWKGGDIVVDAHPDDKASPLTVNLNAAGLTSLRVNGIGEVTDAINNLIQAYSKSITGDRIEWKQQLDHLLDGIEAFFAAHYKEPNVPQFVHRKVISEALEAYDAMTSPWFLPSVRQFMELQCCPSTIEQGTIWIKTSIQNVEIFLNIMEGYRISPPSGMPEKVRNDITTIVKDSFQEIRNKWTVRSKLGNYRSTAMTNVRYFADFIGSMTEKMTVKLRKIPGFEHASFQHVIDGEQVIRQLRSEEHADEWDQVLKVLEQKQLSNNALYFTSIGEWLISKNDETQQPFVNRDEYYTCEFPLRHTMEWQDILAELPNSTIPHRRFAYFVHEEIMREVKSAYDKVKKEAKSYDLYGPEYLKEKEPQTENSWAQTIFGVGAAIAMIGGLLWKVGNVQPPSISKWLQFKAASPKTEKKESFLNHCVSVKSRTDTKIVIQLTKKPKNSEWEFLHNKVLTLGMQQAQMLLSHYAAGEESSELMIELYKSLWGVSREHQPYQAIKERLAQEKDLSGKLIQQVSDLQNNLEKIGIAFAGMNKLSIFPESFRMLLKQYGNFVASLTSQSKILSAGYDEVLTAEITSLNQAFAFEKTEEKLRAIQEDRENNDQHYHLLSTHVKKMEELKEWVKKYAEACHEKVQGGYVLENDPRLKGLENKLKEEMETFDKQLQKDYPNIALKKHAPSVPVMQSRIVKKTDKPVEKKKKKTCASVSVPVPEQQEHDMEWERKAETDLEQALRALKATEKEAELLEQRTDNGMEMGNGCTIYPYNPGLKDQKEALPKKQAEEEIGSKQKERLGEIKKSLEFLAGCFSPTKASKEEQTETNVLPEDKQLSVIGALIRLLVCMHDFNSAAKELCATSLEKYAPAGVITLLRDQISHHLTQLESTELVDFASTISRLKGVIIDKNQETVPDLTCTALYKKLKTLKPSSQSSKENNPEFMEKYRERVAVLRGLLKEFNGLNTKNAGAALEKNPDKSFALTAVVFQLHHLCEHYKVNAGQGLRRKLAHTIDSADGKENAVKMDSPGLIVRARTLTTMLRSGREGGKESAVRGA